MSPFTRSSKASWHPGVNQHRASVIWIALPATEIVVENEIDVVALDNEALRLPVGL